MARGETLAIILLGVVALVVILVRIVRARKEARRQEALEALAEQLGFHFFDAYLSNIPDNSWLIRGDYQQLCNKLEGAYQNYQVQCSDYQFIIEHEARNGEKVEETHTFSVALCDIKIPLKYLLIRHQSILDKVEAAVGIHDITFDSAEFNRTFHVKSEDKKFAYDVIHPRMMEFLLHCGSRYTIELCGNIVLAYKSGALKPDEVKPMLDTLVGFANLLPDYLLEQEKARKEE